MCRRNKMTTLKKLKFHELAYKKNKPISDYLQRQWPDINYLISMHIYIRYKTVLNPNRVVLKKLCLQGLEMENSSVAVIIQHFCHPSYTFVYDAFLKTVI